MACIGSVGKTGNEKDAVMQDHNGLGNDGRNIIAIHPIA
jgi:hypothetical protein